MDGAIASTAATSVTGSVTAVAIRFPSRINYAADRNSEIKGRLSRTGLLSRSRSELANVFGRSRRRAAIEQPCKWRRIGIGGEALNGDWACSFERRPCECSGLATSCSWCAFSLEFPKINKWIRFPAWNFYIGFSSTGGDRRQVIWFGMDTCLCLHYLY